MPADFGSFLAAIREQISGTGSRSHILNSLLIPLGISATVFVASFYFKAPQWIQVTSFAVLIVSFFFYLGFFAYFAFTSPEFLRSERYSIQKLAIERGVVGDSQAGIIDLKANETPDGTLPKPDNKNGRPS